MNKSSLIYAFATLLCVALFFSCTPEVEAPPTNEQNSSSSDTEQPPPPPPNKSSSSSSQPTPISSPSSSSSSRNSSNSSNPSSSSNAQKSSSSGSQVSSGGCKENNPKAGFACSWDGYAAGSILTPGKILAPTYDDLPSGCSSVSWRYAPDTAGLALNYECKSVDEDGIDALGSRNYVLFAELTCGSTKHTTACNPKTGWSSKQAPGLVGECKWAKNPTTTARGGIPSGVSVVDADKVCTNPTVVYKYDGGTRIWPATGLVEAGTYKDVEATLNCPDYSQIITVPCPTLEVNEGADHIIECTCSGSSSCNLSYDICKADGISGSYDVTLKEGECVEINVYGYNDKYAPPDVGMRCNPTPYTTFTVSVNGKSITASSTSDLIPLGKLNLGDNEFGTLCLTGGTTSIKCRGPSY